MEVQVPQSTIKVILDATSIINEKSDFLKLNSPSILTRLHAGYFRISLSVGAQALLWKTLSEHTIHSQSLHRMFHTFPSTAFVLLWWTALCTQILLSILYILRCIFHSHMVKAEFLHHVGVNYLFAPWISWLLLLQSAPFVNINTFTYEVLWCLFVAPIVILDIKIYGQWFTTEKRFLSLVANPTSQISVIANLVAAWVAAQMEWKESSVCIFSLGLAHYLVVFITLYQRLSGADRLPAMLRPVFFLFVAAPSIASLAWSSISGNFEMPCKMLFFLSLFLFTSLACRPGLFKRSMKRFNVAWWAYSFPITFLALASAEYARQIKGFVASVLMLLISGLAVVVLMGTMIATALNIGTLLREDDPCLSFIGNS